MEADMVVELVNNVHGSSLGDSTVCVGAVVGDEDSATIARVHKEVDERIEKKSDFNHLKKILGNKLYALQAKHRTLTVKVIKYLQKCFSYMLKQNQGNANGIRMGLKALSFHPFGEHQYCDGSWCGYLHKGANYKFKSLPYGRPLNDPVLKEELNSVFEGFQCAADKLANTDSTQANENFNNIVASKAPKSCCYAGSDSLNFRVGAAVLQKNDGYSYVSSVNERIGMSPGKYCVSRASYLDNQERKRRMKSQTRCAKKRRIELKANKYLRQSVQELREGDTYTTGIDLVQKTQDIQEIPSPSTEPVPQPIELTDQPVVYLTWRPLD
ncbi:uncharacterized protein [Ptychodera flava]|uniref:uncharacterized protein n=1 Tax=Ptychodera flava TaxID=63121 RepID=UPI00396A6D2B